MNQWESKHAALLSATDLNLTEVFHFVFTRRYYRHCQSTPTL